MKKNLVLTTALMCTLLITGACSSSDNGGSEADETVTLSLGTKMPSNSPEGEAFEYFAEIVDEKSEGKMEVKLHPDEQLGGGTAQIDNLQTGSQDMYADSSAFFSDCDARFEVASAPYLFINFDQFQEFMLGETGQEMAQNMIDNCDLRIVNTERNFQRGPYRVMLSKDPVESLEDLEGLNLRLAESKLQTGLYNHLGANPTEVAFSETYLAINQGIAEAVNSPISQVWSMKFTEVAPNMTITDEYPQEVVFIMNNDKYEDLSEEQQQIITEAANEAGDEGVKLANEAADEDIDKMKEQHDINIHEIDKEKWVEAVAPFYEEYEAEGNLPEGTIESILSME